MSDQRESFHLHNIEGQGTIMLLNSLVSRLRKFESRVTEEELQACSHTVAIDCSDAAAGAVGESRARLDAAALADRVGKVRTSDQVQIQGGVKTNTDTGGSGDVEPPFATPPSTADD